MEATSAQTVVLLERRQSRNLTVRQVTEALVTLVGIALIALAAIANHSWFLRHFLPTFFAPFEIYEIGVQLGRVALAGSGILLVVSLRPRLGRTAARRSPRQLASALARVLLAAVLALGMSEWALRHTVFGLAAEETPPQVEPKRQRDPWLGWTHAPGRTGRELSGTRVIEYSMDANGYRVRSANDKIDFHRPSILFAGESIMVGHGLTWDESVPGQVQKLLGIQTANLAVEGFATDQAYLRLAAELPRFRRPVAVVALFTPSLFDRNLDTDRPHLEPGFVWKSGRHRSSLVELVRWLLPFHTESAIKRSAVVTQEVLRATVDLAQARRAACVILVPQFIPENIAEREVRQRILDEAGLPYERVELGSEWHLAWDRHPDARGAHAMAVAIVNRLRKP